MNCADLGAPAARTTIGLQLEGSTWKALLIDTAKNGWHGYYNCSFFTSGDAALTFVQTFQVAFDQATDPVLCMSWRTHPICRCASTNASTSWLEVHTHAYTSSSVSASAHPCGSRTDAAICTTA